MLLIVVRVILVLAVKKREISLFGSKSIWPSAARRRRSLSLN